MIAVTKTARAERDLIDIWLYVAVHSPDAADRLLDRIEERSGQLSRFPYSGVSRDDLLTGLRQLVVGRYLVFHKVSDANVDIVRVLNGRRDLSAEDFSA